MSVTHASRLSPHASIPTLAVLAGGAGTRMGKPKALLTVAGRPILSWLTDQLQWPGPTLLVTAPAVARPPGAAAFSAEAVDPVDGNGPLQGVHTALAAATTERVAFTTVDMPNVRRPLLQWLIERLGEADGVMCRRGDQIEPFPCVLRRSTIGTVAARLAEARRSVYGLSFEPRIKTLPAPSDWPQDTWLNLNRPEEFAAWAASKS